MVNVVMLNVVVQNVVAPIEISEIIEAQWGPIKANHNFGKSYNFVQLGFSVSNRQKVQLNIDLLKHRTPLFIRNTNGSLKLNEIKV
jgi:hypothetical protein